MRLLICTQIVDSEDPILGFFHRWIEEFAKNAEQVTVICLKEGTHRLPDNVRVLSLGKEKGHSRLQYIIKFYYYIWRERHAYDAVFVHMNQVYVLLGGIIWRLLGKQIGLWYVHRSVTLGLRLAVIFAHTIFTAAPGSFRINTRKRLCIGHGIDTEALPFVRKEEGPTLRVVTIGRVSPTKRIAEMIHAIRILNDTGVSAALTIVGSAITERDKLYEHELIARADQYSKFIGVVPHAELSRVLQGHDVFLNLSLTESMDKAVLEALSAGLPVVTSNPTFREMLKPLGLFVDDADPTQVVSALQRAHGLDVHSLSILVRKKHSLPRLIQNILQTLARENISA